MPYQIGEVAKLAKVSIRTLHHYDEIGLLVPSLRNEAGYRLYSGDDLHLLQVIRFYRTLEFSLTDVKALLSASDFDREAILLQQRELLRSRASELDSALALIENTLAALRDPEENPMSNEAMFEVFPDLDESVQKEAEQRWGNSDGWRQCQARIKRYQKADWLRMKDEMATTYKEAERVFRIGARPDSREAMACAEADRLMIQRWFYDCSHEMHASVKAGTSQDPRFVANIDRQCPGLAAWLHQAAVANAKQPR